MNDRTILKTFETEFKQSRLTFAIAFLTMALALHRYRLYDTGLLRNLPMRIDPDQNDWEFRDSTVN